MQLFVALLQAWLQLKCCNGQDRLWFSSLFVCFYRFKAKLWQISIYAGRKVLKNLARRRQRQVSTWRHKETAAAAAVRSCWCVATLLLTLKRKSFTLQETTITRHRVLLLIYTRMGRKKLCFKINTAEAWIRVLRISASSCK